MRSPVSALNYAHAIRGSVIRDAVCGKEIEDRTEYMAPHGAYAYFFCSEACKEKFLRNPTHYERAEREEKNKPQTAV